MVRKKSEVLRLICKQNMLIKEFKAVTYSLEYEYMKIGREKHYISYVPWCVYVLRKSRMRCGLIQEFKTSKIHTHMCGMYVLM